MEVVYSMYMWHTTLKHLRKSVGRFDKYNHGKVVSLDFQSSDCCIVWVQYKLYCKAYWAY